MKKEVFFQSMRLCVDSSLQRNVQLKKWSNLGPWAGGQFKIFEKVNNNAFKVELYAIWYLCDIQCR